MKIKLCQRWTCRGFLLMLAVLVEYSISYGLGIDLHRLFEIAMIAFFALIIVTVVMMVPVEE